MAADRIESTEAPPIAAEAPLKSWQDGVAPAFISLFLSAVYLDRLAPRTLLVGGLGPSAVGACFAGLLGYWCLYYAPALWGATTRKPLSVVATSTFGSSGAVYVPGLVVGVAYVLWFAVTIDFATQYGLAGVIACGLTDGKSLEFSSRGVPSNVFLFTAAAWSVASAIIGTLAVRLVSAIMSAYVIAPALVIGAAVVWAIPAASAGPVETHAWNQGGGRAVLTMAGLVFSFLACHGLTSADWGSISKTPRDARVGGMVGLMFAAPILSVLSLLVVAGALGRAAPKTEPSFFPPRANPAYRPPDPRLVVTPKIDPNRATLRVAFTEAIGGRIGGTALLVLALGLLGPACSTPWVIGRQFSSAWPRVSAWKWSLVGAVATWPLIASGRARDIGVIFPAIGILTAPAVGAIAADYARSRGVWPGPRPRWNWAGLIAWSLGVASGLSVACFARHLGWVAVAFAAPSAFAMGFLAYLVSAWLGLEPKSPRVS